MQWNRRRMAAAGFVLGLGMLSGCGATGINPLPSGQTSVFAGSYSGPYTGVKGERGTIVVNIATTGTALGTLTNSVVNQSGPLSGVVRQDGTFKLFYHLNNSATVYSGTGVVTKASNTGTSTTSTTATAPSLAGTWNITSPTSTTLTFILAPQ